MILSLWSPVVAESRVHRVPSLSQRLPCSHRQVPHHQNTKPSRPSTSPANHAESRNSESVNRFPVPSYPTRKSPRFLCPLPSDPFFVVPRLNLQLPGRRALPHHPTTAPPPLPIAIVITITPPFFPHHGAHLPMSAMPLL